MSNFPVTKNPNSRISSVNWDKLGFGVYFSDHIFVSDYTNGAWDEGKIIPYGPMQLEPTNCTLHYGQTIFEGLKAFRTKDGINIFRPYNNARRLNRSALRVCIPPYDDKKLVEALKQLVALEYDWIPKERGQALYLRPLVFGTSNFLGVHPSSDYRLIVICSPVASYYAEGLSPVKILISSRYARAVRGGLGTAKTAANYAASLLAAQEAKELGFSQVLWLDAVSRRFIDEVGAMNIMFVIDDTLITPSLSEGTILEGVTRDAVLTLARDFGMKVEERPVTVEEIFDTHKSGKLQEIFGTGTAAVISPVGLLSYNNEKIVINDMKIGPFAQKFYDTITGIQYGELEDKHNWNVSIKM